MKRIIAFFYISAVCFGVLAETENYYEILGISPDSSQEEIQKAYRRLAMKFHPDRSDLPEEQANEEMKKVNTAYAILYDRAGLSTIEKWMQAYPDPDVRVTHAEIAWVMGQKAGQSILNVLVQDLSKKVRMKVLEMSVLAEDEEVEIEILRQLARDEAEAIRRSVVGRVYKLRDLQGKASILNILVRDPSTVVRLTVLRIAVTLEDFLWRELLDVLVVDASSTVRSQIPRDITIFNSQIPEEERVKILKRLMHDEDKYVRQKVAEGAGELKDSQASASILNVLVGDSDFRVIERVIRKAVNLDLENAKSVISQILHDHPDLEMRNRANEYVRFYFPGLFSGIDSVERGTCEAGFTKP